MTAVNIACLCTVAASTASAESYLYSPRPVETEKPPAEEGVLVKEITIRKGDTLSGISRAYSGHASYYPQILLFNEISDPDLIYAGKALRVPVGNTVKEEKEKKKEKREVKKEVRGAEQRPVRKKRKKKVAPAQREKKAAAPPEAAVSKAAPPSVAPRKAKPSRTSPPVSETVAPEVKPRTPAPEQREERPEQRAYEKAVAVYRQGACREAIALCDSFLKRFPNSAFAADISLYRADCHLRLSEE